MTDSNDEYTKARNENAQRYGANHRHLKTEQHFKDGADWANDRAQSALVNARRFINERGVLNQQLEAARAEIEIWKNNFNAITSVNHVKLLELTSATALIEQLEKALKMENTRGCDCYFNCTNECTERTTQTRNALTAISEWRKESGE